MLTDAKQIAWNTRSMDIDDPERGTGRTRAMVMQLPETGSIVVVHSYAMRDYVRHMIRDLRGPNIEQSTKIVAIFGFGDVHRLEDALRGTYLPIFIDHAFHRMIPNREVLWLVAEIDKNHRYRIFERWAAQVHERCE